MNVFFSILIPAYKEVFLEECINSILAQDYPHFEIIIVDDSSPFDLGSIVDKYNDERIHYSRNTIGHGALNVVGNWNQCLQNATGEYVICMGDDDCLLPHCLSDYVKLIEKYPKCLVFHTNTQIIDENSKIIDIQESRPEYESAFSLLWHRWFGGRSKQFIGDFLFETASLKQRGGFFPLPYGWHSDAITVLNAASNGIANSPDFGFQYRVNRQTISYSTEYYKEKLEATLLSNAWYKDFLSTQRPSNEGDKIYLQIINQRFQDHAIDACSGIIKDDICYNFGLRTIIHWINNRKRINFSTKKILSLTILALYKRIRLSSNS